MGQSPSRFREILASSVKVGVATLASLLGWIVGGKILALELGAAGVGIFGLLRQLLQNLTLASTFNCTTALVQGLASRQGEEQSSYVRSVGGILALGAGAIALLLVAGAPWLAGWLLPHPDAVVLLRWTALAVVATTAQTYLTGVLNGHRAVDALVRTQLAGPAAVLLLAYPTAKLVQRGQPAGLVLLLALPGVAVSFFAALQVRRRGWLPRPGAINRGDAAAFFRTSLVMLFTGLLSTGAQFLQNRLVAGGLGLEQAGHYWVAWTLSMAYVTILLSSYGTYYLPGLSALREPEPRRALIRDYLRLGLLVMPLLVSLVVLVKPLVVRILFSEQLIPALRVMRWMLVGDYFKGIAWILSFPMLAFTEMRWFLATEVVFNLLLAGGSWAWLAGGGGIEGLGVLFLTLYVLYLLAMVVYVRVCHGLPMRRGEVATFLGGLALVGAVSASTWADTRVELRSVLVFIVFSTLFVVAALIRSRRAVAASN